LLALPLCRISSTTLQGSATADHAQQDDDDGDYQQDMDKPAYGVRTDQADQPQDEEYDCNGIEHGNFLSGFLVNYGMLGIAFWALEMAFNEKHFE
jgi:hypothetical protein